MTVDLAPYLDAVPDAVVERLRGARRVLAVGHENPDADTLGATLGGRPPRRGARRDRPTRSAPTRPAAVRLHGRRRPVPDRSGPGAPTTTSLVISDCGSLERVGEVGVRHADLFARLPRVIIDHHASNDAAGDADWIDPQAAATCEMVTLLAARLGIPLDVGDGATGGRA